MLLLASILAPTFAVPVAAGAQDSPLTEPVLVVEGKGWGHGVGMAQDGALALGQQGLSTIEILQHFYPGTGTGTGSGPVRIPVLDAAGGEAVVSFPSGGEVRSSRSGPQAPGFPVSVAPGGSVRLRFDGSYRVEPLSGATVAVLGAAPGQLATAQAPADEPPSDEPPSDDAASVDEAAPEEDQGGLLENNLIGPDNPPPENLPPAPTVPEAPPPPPPGQPLEPAPAEELPSAEIAPPENVAVSGTALWAVPSGAGAIGVPARSALYRGVVHAVAGGGGLQLVNEVDVEEYLRGMGEVRDSSWPRASLGAQAVAARTYALRAMALGGSICDTQDCQVYLGVQAEYGAMDAAVAATRGLVVTYGGTLAQTVYSASGGGVSATPTEGFGTSDRGLPYLGAVSYPTNDPQAWGQRIPLSQLGRRFGYPGTLADVRIATAGPSGRALTVELVGDAGPKAIPALAFDDTLGFRSTLWTLRIETSPVDTGDAGAGAGAGAERGSRTSWVGATQIPQGRLLISDDAANVAILASLEGPLRAAAALSSAVLLLGVWAGAVFRVVARRSPRTLRRSLHRTQPKQS